MSILRNIKIRFIPYVYDKNELANYYQAADILLSSSLVEVWGLSITEALSCGTPVVATEVGGIPEQIISWRVGEDNKANGILVNPGNAGGLATALESFIK